MIMNLETLEEIAGAAISREDEQLVIEKDGRMVRGLAARVDTSTTVALERALSHLLMRSAPDRAFALLLAPSVTMDAEQTLEDFVARYAPDRAWGYLDDSGAARVVIPELGLDERRRSVIVEAKTARLDLSTHTASITTTRNQSLFTDLNQWLLKVMILNHAPDPYWDKPRVELSGPVDLSKVDWVDVSQGKAYQFAHTLREMGYLVWRRGTFRLVEVERLLHAWLEVARAERPHRVAVRSPLGDTVREVFGSAEERADYAYAGVLAAEVYGLRHVTSQLEEVYVFGDTERLVSELLLEVCDENLADFFLLRPTHRASIQRGVQVHGDREERAVDLVQSALDSVRRPARGEEQAEYIMSEIARWFE